MQQRHRRHRVVLGAVALALAATALQAGPARADAAAGADPFEAVNRRIHAFNQGVRANVLGPLAELYLAATPAEVRRGIGDALANLNEPITALSGLAAGEVPVAMNAAARFGINSTLGLGGVRDRAGAMGYPRQPFGVADVACRWGVPSGPFVVLPLLGPSTLRDAGALAAAGAALSQALGPDVYLAWSGGDLFVAYAERHPDLARVDAQSLDAYAVHRSAYLQRRAARCPIDRARGLEGDADDRRPAP
jgi:phospholipid-binding lipoprotein MlaA